MIMNKMIAYCGLTCDSCPIHLATLEKNKSTQQTMREAIAELCSRIYRIQLQADDQMDCDGCRTTAGRLFFGCFGCEIRGCASLKKIENCAYCGEFACVRLKKHFLMEPGALANLEEIRKTMDF